MLRQFIARFRSIAVVCVAATTLAIASLTACGVKGPLKLPPATPAATGTGAGTGAGGSTPEAQPAAATAASDESAPKTPETKP